MSKQKDGNALAGLFELIADRYEVREERDHYVVWDRKNDRKAHSGRIHRSLNAAIFQAAAYEEGIGNRAASDFLNRNADAVNDPRRVDFRL